MPSLASTPFLGLLSFFSLTAQALQPYNGPTPSLPERAPFGFGSLATGGGESGPNNTYLVDNMMDLREALTMDKPRVVYIKGEINGNQVDANTTADCQWYIDESNTPKFNFTRYLMAMNETYMGGVKDAAEAEEPFEGGNATELLEVLKRQNGWRTSVNTIQKQYQSIDAQGNLTLIGYDSSAYLNGVNLVFNSRSNIIMRNLRLSPPRDCFPAPETYPNSWNARYDAVSMVTTHTVWFDGNIFEDGPEPVEPDDALWGWKVDRYDGLFDAEDGTDNVTFSHNIVANHHKSLLWGGGEKEAERDLGKMRFTVFGNHFKNSMSRNPLMRFGTYYIVNNLFENYENKEPLYESNGTSGTNNSTAEVLRFRVRDDTANATYSPDFQYNMGIYNLSSVLVSGNAFQQSGLYPDDTTRIFSFSDLATPDYPAKLCSPPDLSAAEQANATALKAFMGLKSQFNGADIDLIKNAEETFEYHVANKDDSVEGGFTHSCEGFGAQELPGNFTKASDVLKYVRENAGQMGRNEP